MQSCKKLVQGATPLEKSTLVHTCIKNDPELENSNAAADIRTRITAAPCTYDVFETLINFAKLMNT
jgi:hypothetical protein